MPFESAAVKLTASLGRRIVDFPLRPAEACGTWGLICPSATGTQQTLKISIPVDASIPRVRAGVELQLVANTHDILICETFDVEIV
ncbi:Npc2-like protein [Moelleriella libera RCEF 2490]|uniref:Phosphatidylglycerol/phosphatidylinositol transfer protein n=1 Tax=Moelleriella libera RCEF 2490 TaxID=1081109 RepID=A0A168BKI8_9HYPO|nr:Npc2-like protein [Moelleriella libera RCEF 2490]